jgi:hypothetical protein
VQIAAIVNPSDLGQLIIGVCVKIGAIMLERVHQKNFSRESGRDDGTVLQDLGALDESGVDCHEPS